METMTRTARPMTGTPASHPDNVLRAQDVARELRLRISVLVANRRASIGSVNQRVVMRSR
jgi:hypothetical protein